jgi:beta-glucosidase/6-phospho-beta-glucosidase/beta-galactosidase
MAASAVPPPTSNKTAIVTKNPPPKTNIRESRPIRPEPWGSGAKTLSIFDLKKYKKPIFITENGIADAKDIKREKFIKEHLYFANKAMQAGVDLRGYFYWSLLDNFEWAHGFWPRFGLVEIDREDLLRRKVRHSALKYAEICKNNGFEYLI